MTFYFQARFEQGFKLVFEFELVITNLFMKNLIDQSINLEWGNFIQKSQTFLPKKYNINLSNNRKKLLILMTRSLLESFNTILLFFISASSFAINFILSTTSN